MNTLQLSEMLGDIPDKDYHKAEVLKKMNIDFYCCCNKPMEEAGKDLGLTDKHLKVAHGQLNAIKTAAVQDFSKWDFDFLTDYIVNRHHRYAKENAIVIYDSAQKVVYHHSENHPELIKLTTAIFFFLHNLLHQMMKEEQILFPNIRQLLVKKTQSGKCMNKNFGLIKESVILMQKSHQEAGEDLKLIQKITNGYSLPEDACNSYKYLFEKMKEFEDDLLLHIHLENNILFPKALVTYEELTKNVIIEDNSPGISSK